MKVMLVNGSPKEKGCTYTALCEVAGALEKNGVETEIFHIGAKAIQGCLACGYCDGDDGCVVKDVVGDFFEKAKGADGFVFGSPVHYAAISGSMKSFMDRLFYAHGDIFRCKPAASVVSCRRAGSTAALDEMNKYFTISQMPVVSSQYWNMVHGAKPDDVKKDLEGMQTMRVLGNNMAWLLKCIDTAMGFGVEKPTEEARIWTNFTK